MARSDPQPTISSYSTGIQPHATIIADLRPVVARAVQDANHPARYFQSALKTLYTHLEDHLSPRGVAWLFVPPPSDPSLHFPSAFLTAATAQTTNFETHAHLHRYRGRETLTSRPFRNTTESVLMVTRTDDYVFDKTPFRTAHVYEKSDWGDRTTSASGYHGNDTNRYHDEGRDRGTVLLEQHRDQDNTPTEFEPHSRAETARRCAAATATDSIYCVQVRGRIAAGLKTAGYELTHARSEDFSWPPLSSTATPARPFSPPNTLPQPADSHIKTLKTDTSTIRFRDSRRRHPDDDPDTAQCIVTSPPYWDLKDYGSPSEIGTGTESYQRYLEELYAVWDTCESLLAPDGLCWVVVDDFVGTNGLEMLPLDVIRTVEATGLTHVETLYWYKPSAMSGYTDKRPVDKCEYALGFATPPFYCSPLADPSATPAPSQTSPRRGDTIRHPVKRGSVGPSLTHDAAFPLSLARDLIASSTRPGDLVFYPFCGSGTTAAAAEHLSRQALGYELTPTYEQDIRTRIPSFSSP